MYVASLWLPHSKCLVEILIDCKNCVRHLNKKILIHFGGSSSATNESNFKILCNSIYALLNVFEDRTYY